MQYLRGYQNLAHQKRRGKFMITMRLMRTESWVHTSLRIDTVQCWVNTFRSTRGELRIFHHPLLQFAQGVDLQQPVIRVQRPVNQVLSSEEVCTIWETCQNGPMTVPPRILGMVMKWIFRRHFNLKGLLVLVRIFSGSVFTATC